MVKERESRDQQIENKRPKRVPLYEQKRDILTARKREAGYEYRFVNDVTNSDGSRRVDSFKTAGWEVAPNTQVGADDANVSLGSTTEAVVEKATGRRAVLMRIPKQFYDEDQKAKQRKITQQERLMIKRKTSAKDSNDGTYGEVAIGEKVEAPQE